ncbi:hypothetical protein [Micromonospora carbonacea]|uniref:Beta/Gamma crystallin n=1 Tax=Micromonospora carbonacea TaxID=47853 RepID=A0A1C4YH36_9ACTN|nr:hypothetical protein [Micromonospora carbonacea]SCF20039.1 hypothetical protein GA0070563_106128 [Micromonospora carbonacea]
MSRKRVSLITAVLAVIVTMALASPASASPATDNMAASGAPGVTATAPSCVSRTVYEVPGGFDVFLQNRCGQVMYVRVIVDWDIDSVCIQLLVNQNRTWHYYGVTGQYRRLDTCVPDLSATSSR